MVGASVITGETVGAVSQGGVEKFAGESAHSVRLSALLGWLTVFIVFEVIHSRLQPVPSEWSVAAISHMVSALEFIEAYYILKLCHEVDPKARVSMGEAAAVVLALSVLIIAADAKPVDIIRLISLYILVGMALVRHAGAVAVSLLALSSQYWIKFDAMNGFHSLVGNFDVTVVGTLLKSLGYRVSVFGSIIISPDPNFAVDVMAGCASSSVAAGVLPAFVIVVLGRRRTFKPPDFGWMAGLLVAAFCLNWMRLALMALNREGYLYWHGGDGASQFALVAAGLPLIFAWAATRSRKSEMAPGSL